jgi:putative ABC transport system permease protein
MQLKDLMKMSYGSLRRTKLRTILTGAGVIIGIGALTSMISFGAGMQKNVADAMKKTDVFTSIEVMPRSLESLGKSVEKEDEKSQPEKALNDSTIQWIASLKGVKLAYPEVIIPSQLKLSGPSVPVTVRAVPMQAGEFYPFNQLEFGSYFSSDTAKEIILSKRLLKRLHFDHADSAVGRKVSLITAKVGIDFDTLLGLPSFSSENASLFKEEINELLIVGVWAPPEFTGSRMAEASIPMGTSKRIARFDFRNVWDLLKSFGGNTDGYPLVYVRVGSFRDVEETIKTITDAGYGVFNVLQQLDELRRGFLIFDAILGTVGTIALLVASLGIINTMVMSVLERYREIGIMKALGATDADVKLLFVFESSVIGFVGGILGIILGWIVTRIAQVIGNQFIIRQGGEAIDLFYIPFWLIAGSILFAILVSLLAGLYPARRAAKVDPVQALRHE